jgi:primary-amine oxidase
VSETAADHPLAALTGTEIAQAVALARSHEGCPADALVAYVGLQEPPKDRVRAFRPGDPLDREVRLVLVPGPRATVVEAVVSVTHREVRRWHEVPEARPALLIEESIATIEALKADPEWRAAMRRRGIDDFEKVQIDPWPAGNFGLDHEHDRRISRCLSYLRETPDANGYAKPIEGVVGFVDMGRGEVLEVLDTGVVPIPPGSGSYDPGEQALRADLRPLEITQPEGPSFTVEGNLVRWQRWSFRVTMDPLEGLVLWTLGYEDGGRVRPVLYRASVSEMVVPYGSPDPMHSWKNAFDVGEWGLGRMANSLAFGCDCLGEIHYFDVDYADERGQPHTLANAICMHEEDYGILWKHVDLHVARAEVRRSRRLVISSIATVGNYDYGFYWYLYLDGTVQLEVKLTGIMSPQAVPPGAEPDHAVLVAPQIAAPYHQHLFNVRLDMEVDGPANTVYEVDTRLESGHTFAPVATPLETELGAQRLIDPAASRHWRIVNRSVVNGLGQPTAYKLVPGPTPTLLADPASSVGRRARFATRNLWVTRFDPAERRAAGDHPNQHPGGDGLPAWTAADRPIADEDVVLWYTFGVTHVPRPEDWPVMPVEYAGFSLMPVGFFDRNPALDVPPPAGGHCHAGAEGSQGGA